MSLVSAVPALLAAVLFAVAPPRAAAQHPGDFFASRLEATRPELEARLDQLRALAQGAHPPGWLAAEVLYIQRRLDAGDFRTGDRILIAVEDPLPLEQTPERPMPVGKSQEQQLSDTFTVAEALDVVLPGVGRVPLHGVLRSELEGYLAGKIGRAIRDPVVHAWPLVSVGVTGEVVRPGFYAVPPNVAVSAVLTAAGGPTKDAKVNKMTLERDGRSVLKGNDLRRAIEQGRTLDQLLMQPGDMLAVPTKHSWDNLYRPLQFVAVLATIWVAYFAISPHVRF